MPDWQIIYAPSLGVAIGLLRLLYAMGAVGLALYGLHAFWLTMLLRRQRTVPPVQPQAPAELPYVTVQLPIYNERHVVERLLDSIAALDYPRDRLQIQLLDDSDDVTASIADAAAMRLSRQGTTIEIVRRPDRSGYKAGALAHALPMARGEYIAIFDADFLPPADFLQRSIPWFTAPQSATAKIAFVQARWDHLDRDYSWLTRCQALALDGHFGVEQPARYQAGFPFGFNGSAGVWSLAAIVDPNVGGWSADTLCEDLDLAYRAQLAGWRGLFLDDLGAPAEIPPQLAAFKRQQARWAKGSIQTLVKLAPRVVQSEWRMAARAAGIFHLGNYLVHPILILMLVSAALLNLLGAPPPAPLIALSFASLGPPLLYATAQRRLHPTHWLQNFLDLPLLMLVGLGVGWNNTLAVWDGFRTHGGDFARTPKFDIGSSGGDWRQSSYRLPLTRQTIGEIVLALLALVGAASALERGDYGSAFFMALYFTGFGAVAAVGLWQARRSAAPVQSRRREAHTLRT